MDPLKSESVPGPDPIPGGGGPVRVPGGGWALASGGPSAYHPFECRPGCVHCDRRAVDGHDPATCLACRADELGGELEDRDPPDPDRDPFDPEDAGYDDHDTPDAGDDVRPASFDPVDDRPVTFGDEEDERPW